MLTFENFSSFFRGEYIFIFFMSIFPYCAGKRVEVEVVEVVCKWYNL